MSQADRFTDGASKPFRTVSHYASPYAVLGDDRLSAAEKRAVLSSWASDMYAVESNPALRDIPGIPRPLRLSEILAALRSLDDEDGPPPRGGVAMRVVPRISINAVARPAEATWAMPHRTRAMPSGSRAPHRSRWNREANIQRYRRLLATELTDRERLFVERRLAEELQGTSAGTTPGAGAASKRQSSYSAEMSRPV